VTLTFGNLILLKFVPCGPYVQQKRSLTILSRVCFVRVLPREFCEHLVLCLTLNRQQETTNNEHWTSSVQLHTQYQRLIRISYVHWCIQEGVIWPWSTSRPAVAQGEREKSIR